MTHRLALRALVFLAIGAVLAGARCANPCVDLSARVCEDLGPTDCALWAHDPSISEGILPGKDYASRRATVANTTCRMWASESNYRAHTLPLIRWRIANVRAPGQAGPPPSMHGLEPPPDALGLPPIAYYACGPVAILLVFAFAWIGRRRLRSAQAQATSTTKRWGPPS